MKTNKTPKKPAKSAKPECKKACNKACETPCTKTTTIDAESIFGGIIQQGADDLKMYTALAAKSAEVTKGLLELVQRIRDSVRKTSELVNGIKDGTLEVVKATECNVKDTVKTINGLLGDAFKQYENQAKAEKDAKEADARCFQTIAKYSKFQLTNGTFFRRAPQYDTKDGAAYEVSFNAETVDHEANTTYGVSEVIIVHLYDSLERTVKEFDEKVSKLTAIKVPLKKAEKPCKKDCKGKCSKECKKVEKVEKTEKKEPSAPWPVKEITELLLAGTKYDIKPRRLKVFADHVDGKHGNRVYKIQFLSGSYKTSETKFLNVRIKGEQPKLLVARFDKLVKSLKTVKFDLKK